MVNLFTLFKKKTPVQRERKPLNLPEIPADKMDLVNIAAMINEGTPIWTWTSLLDKWNTTAMLNMQGNALDGFAMFRKEYDYLVKYVAVVDQNQQSMTLKISEICKCTTSNILELINTELRDAYRIYYDTDRRTETLQFYVHNLDDETIDKHLKNERVLYVSDDHFIKKVDAENGIERDVR